MSAPLKIAVAGIGTVGAGLLRLLRDDAALLAARCGRPIAVTAVSARDRGRDRGVDLTAVDWYDDAVAMARDADADVIVELIGGADGPAKAVCQAALDGGRHVVTANKALLAEHGTALALQAEDQGVAIGYEAAVAGGIPIVKALREGLSGNRIDHVSGILNGTCNYILSTMRQTGKAFEDVLTEAQALGYAEADPSFDVDGIDAAHKLAILTALAFGTRIDFDGVAIEGIRTISPLDIAYADELGFRIKLLGIARRTDRGIEQRVHPCMVPRDSALGTVEGVYNAVRIVGSAAADTTYEGRGAGAGPTASAVAADIVDIARGRLSPTFGVPADQLQPLEQAALGQHVGSYYVRLMVRDEPGVIADISAALRDERVSLEAVIQRSRSREAAVPVVLTTHDTIEESMGRAMARIGALQSVMEEPCVIRIEQME